MRHLWLCVLLAGCGSASDFPVQTSSPSTAGLSGQAAPGAQLRAYPLLPDGRIGEDREGVSSYPVQPPTSLASAVVGSDGKFSLGLAGTGPFVVEAFTGTVPWRILLREIPNGPVTLDTASTLGASADLARLRVGQAATFAPGPSAVLSEAQREAQMEAIESAPVVSAKYVSPYTLTFAPELTTDLVNWQISSESDMVNWYDPSAYPAGQLSWGPRPHHFAGMALASAADKRQRVLAVGHHWIGTHYQHHHIPDWAPSNWPAWMRVSLGHNSAGIDCSDFTSWCYNVGLGIQITSNVADQGADTTYTKLFQVTGFEVADYNTLVNGLLPGDLLYIRANSGRANQPITHVIMWVGGPNNLIMDSHDNTPPVKDSNGNVIPAGVHLRPFVQGSWYHRAFDHAHRLIGP
jgi:cell wall-associated NlpC family hydrolase